MVIPQRGARDLVTDIITAISRGDNDAAARAASWGIASFPDAAVFHRLRGTALGARGENDEAKANLNQALTVDPLDHEALVTLSQLEEGEGDLYTAAEHLLTAWEHDPANSLLRSDLTHRLARLYGSEGYLQYTRPALAALYVRNAYPERAAREYAAALAEQPTRIDLRLASVLARWRLGALPEAIEGCIVLLDEQPNLVRARWVLADALARRGKGEEAREHARAAALLDPDGAIARDLIESNAEATIVDPDEMVRILADTRHPAPDGTTSAPHEMSPRVVPLFPTQETPRTERSAFAEQPEATTHHPTEPSVTATNAPVTLPIQRDASVTAVTSAGTSAMDDIFASPLRRTSVDHGEPTAATQTHPEIRTPDRPDRSTTPDALVTGEETAPADAVLSPPTPQEEPESVMAVVAENGAITTMLPGDEPALEPDDAPELPDETEIPVITPEQRVMVAEGEPDRATAAEGDQTTAPAPGTFPTNDADARFPTAVTAPVPANLPTADALWPAMQARLAADDVPGALALGRAALTAVGKDTARVRPLLPAMRALVDAAPNRADSRRLLGDTYRRLGQTAQAQGQYQQALLVRVAGKK